MWLFDRNDSKHGSEQVSVKEEDVLKSKTVEEESMNANGSTFPPKGEENSTAVTLEETTTPSYADENPQESPSNPNSSPLPPTESSLTGKLPTCKNRCDHDNKEIPSGIWNLGTLSNDETDRLVSVGGNQTRQRKSRKAYWGDEVEGQHLVEVLGENESTCYTSRSAPNLFRHSSNDEPATSQRDQSIKPKLPIKSAMKRATSSRHVTALHGLRAYQGAEDEEQKKAKELTDSVVGSLAALAIDSRLHSQDSVPLPATKSVSRSRKNLVCNRDGHRLQHIHAAQNGGTENVLNKDQPCHTVLHPSMCVPRGIADRTSVSSSLWATPIQSLGVGANNNNDSVSPLSGHYSPQWGWYIATTPPTPPTPEQNLGISLSSSNRGKYQGPVRNESTKLNEHQHETSIPLNPPLYLNQPIQKKKPFPFGGSMKQKEKQQRRKPINTWANVPF